MSKICVVCHDNMIVFAKNLEYIFKILSNKNPGSAIDLVLIEDNAIRKQTILQLLLLEVSDVLTILKDYSYSKKNNPKLLYNECTSAADKKSFLLATAGYDQIYIITSKYIFPESYTVNKKIYNIHCGLLPNYRGLFPTFWSYMEANHCGVTLHKIDKEIDKGELLGSYQMESFKSYYKTLRELYTNGIKLIEARADSNIDSIKSISDYYKLPSVLQIINYKLRRFFR